MNPLTRDEHDRLVFLARNRTAATHGEWFDLHSRHNAFVTWAERAAYGQHAERVSNTRTGYDAPAAAPGRTTAGPAGATISRARRLVEGLHQRHAIPDAGAGALERLLEHRDEAVSWRVADMVEALGSEQYLKAFTAVVRDPQNGAVLLSDAERSALARGRAMSVGVGGSGGYAVPLQLDPALILTSAGTISAVRKNARIELSQAKELDLVTSAGASAGWAAEGQEAGDDSPTLAQPVVKGVRMQAFIPFSMELDASWATAVAELTRALTDAADILDAQARVGGAGGTAAPQGIATALAGSALTTASTAVVTLADLQAAQEALAPRFRGRNPRWVAPLSAIHKFRTFNWVTNGESIVQGTPGNLTMLDWPLDEDSNMDALGAPTSGRNILIGGDWKQYVVLDQWPSTVELVMHLFGPANRYPTGQRGLYLIRRTGGLCLTTAAFSMLQIK